MMRILLFLIMASIAACGCSRAEGNSKPDAKPEPPQVSEIVKEYKHLQAMTDGPVFVNADLAALCRGVSRADIEEAKKRTGPHTNTAVRIYMNDLAAEAFRKSATPYPVGSVVVKEKQGMDFTSERHRDSKTPDGVGGMIKRAPGFDAEHGDWEYFYFENPSKVESGKIVTCVQCHIGAAAKDYVFGNWAQGEK